MRVILRPSTFTPDRLIYMGLILPCLNFLAKIFNDEKMILHGHHNIPMKRMTFQYLSLVHASIDETYNFKIYTYLIQLHTFDLYLSYKKTPN